MVSAAWRLLKRIVIMNKKNRRVFLQTSAAALAGGFGTAHPALFNDTSPSVLALGLSPTQAKQTVSSNDGKKPLRLGLIIGIRKDPGAAISKVHDLGLPTCQVYVDDFEPAQVGRLRQALDKHGIEATSLVVGGPGEEVYDFYRGPLTIRLVPRQTPAAPISHIKHDSDFANHSGTPPVST